MTTTIRENCLIAFKTQLQTIAGVTVYRFRDVDITKDQMPCLVMIDGGEQTDESSFYKHISHMNVGVESYLRASTDDQLGPAISDLYGKIKAAIMSNRTLGGNAVDCTVATDAMSDPIIERVEGKPPGAAFQANFIIEFHTKPNDPTQAA